MIYLDVELFFWEFILIGVCWHSWICSLIINVVKFLATVTSLHYNFFCSILSSPAIPVIPMLCFIKLSHSFGFLFYHSLFCLYFNLESFYWYIFNLTDAFLSHVQSSDKSIKSNLHFCLVFLICNIHFLFFQSFHLSLLIHIFLLLP